MATSDDLSCTIHKEQNNWGFCHEPHRVACCIECHKVAFHGCTVVSLQKATDDLSQEVTSLENDLIGIHDVMSQEPSANLLIENLALDSVSNFFSEVTEIVRQCGEAARKKISKSFAEQCSVTEELKQRVLEIRSRSSSKGLSAENKKSSNEGTSNLPTTKAFTTEQLSRKVIELRQLVNFVGHTSGATPELCIDNSKLKVLEDILQKACYMAPANIKIQGFVKKFDFNSLGSYPVMRFVDNTPESPLLVGTWSAGQCTDKLTLIDCDGKELRSGAVSMSPWDLCVKSGLIYLTHGTHISICKLSDLSSVKTFAMSGGCYGIAPIKDQFVVACQYDRCVRIINESGTIVIKSQNSFQDPTFIAVSSAEDAIYVTDSSSVVVLTPDLSNVTRTIRHADLISASGIWFANGMLFVSSVSNSSVIQFTEDGSEGKTIATSDDGLNGPYGICYNIRGRRLAMGNNSGGNNNILVFEGHS